MSHPVPAGVRALLIGLVVVGAIGLAGLAQTGAVFVDDDDGEGTMKAVDSFQDVPAVDDLTVSLTGSKNRTLQIDTAVSDPVGDGDGLSSLTLVVVRTQNGNEAYNETVSSLSGDNADVSRTTGQLKGNEEYKITVTVADDSGDTATASQTKSTGNPGRGNGGNNGNGNGGNNGNGNGGNNGNGNN